MVLENRGLGHPYQTNAYRLLIYRAMTMSRDETTGNIEYFLFFSGEGDYLVSVKFAGHSSAKIATRRASINDISKLLDIVNRQPKTTMSFDEHYGLVQEIRIDLMAKKGTLIVNLISTPQQ